MSKFEKGDVVLVSFPEQIAGQIQARRRPGVIISSDNLLDEVVIAPLNANSAAQTKPASILVKMDSAEGRVAGLRVDSVIDCTVVATIPKALLVSKIGQLSKETMLRVEQYIRGDSAGET